MEVCSVLLTLLLGVPIAMWMACEVTFVLVCEVLFADTTEGIVTSYDNDEDARDRLNAPVAFMPVIRRHQKALRRERFTGVRIPPTIAEDSSDDSSS